MNGAAQNDDAQNVVFEERELPKKYVMPAEDFLKLPDARRIADGAAKIQGMGIAGYTWVEEKNAYTGHTWIFKIQQVIDQAVHHVQEIGEDDNEILQNTQEIGEGNDHEKQQAARNPPPMPTRPPPPPPAPQAAAQATQQQQQIVPN